jgi:NAD(P)-dependent dehydrogenase (short-subunit alcohol dehydrogenase family)
MLLCGLALALLWVGSSAAQSPPGPTPPTAATQEAPSLEPAAMDTLKRMSDVLKNARSFTFTYRTVARDLGPRGITVNTVQPGPVATEMNPPEGPFAETLKGFMALKRYAEIAGLGAYLPGPEAAFVTGASLTIDGGFAA